MPQNFTDISDLIKAAEQQHAGYGGGPERIPPMRPPEASKDHIEVHEVGEHQLDSDVKPYVESHPDKIELPQEVKDEGVESTGHTQFPTYNSVRLPISDDKVLQGLKNPITSSMRWLAEFCVYILDKAHIKLKSAHGKAVRMFDNK